MRNLEDIKVGDLLVFRTIYGLDRLATVTRVGKRLFTATATGDGRYCLVTGMKSRDKDGIGYPHYAVPSEEDIKELREDGAFA